MKEKIKQIILDTQNDIFEYFGADIPLECQRFDINKKLEEMKEEILAILSK